MSLDLNQCDGVCLNCVKSYKKKHSLEKGQGFEIICTGIPSKETMTSYLAGLSKDEMSTAKSIMDPVTWAAENLDWHCLDPDGEIWKRRNPTEYYKWISDHPGEDIYGKSRYHRPYQAVMLRCLARYKVFRCGRQCGKTECLVVSMLYHLFTTPGCAEDEGFKIVVITPYLEQIDLIFTRAEELIRSSSVLKNSISRSVKAPNYTITLYNNSRIKGFTAGTKSGGNAASVRGQHAHMLVFDEADYLSEEDMDAALSIITNHPDASVWMSSTPSGKREKFYETCFMRDWKEFYFPSQVNPLWDKRLENLFSRQLTEIGYRHEVLAEFSQQEEGVFQNAYVQAAKSKYEYGDKPFSRGWTYTIGVDWNDTKNGTQIVVLGLNPNDNKFYIVHRQSVSKEGWTQLQACSEIANMNKLWNPIAIYVDEGYGSTQWEVLRKFSYDATGDSTRGPAHPDSRIKNILHKYNLSSKVETRDLWTQQPIKKDAKPFLIESTVRRFEQQDLKFPSSDELLEKQLLGYIIKRVSNTGKPIYEAINSTIGDHIVDALCLAVVAFTLEATPFGKPRFMTNIAFTGRIGEKVDVDIHEGDTVVRSDKRYKIQEEKDNKRPSMSRWSTVADEMSITGSKSLPAAHTNEVSAGRWAWPGFLRDEPAPRVRTLREAGDDARRRLGLRPRRVGKPRRKNI